MPTTTLSRRRFHVSNGQTALGLTTPALLTACGSKDDGASSATGEIELWIDIQGDANQKYFTDNVVAAFKKAKP